MAWLVYVGRLSVVHESLALPSFLDDRSLPEERGEERKNREKKWRLRIGRKEEQNDVHLCTFWIILNYFASFWTLWTTVNYSQLLRTTQTLMTINYCHNGDGSKTNKKKSWPRYCIFWPLSSPKPDMCHTIKNYVSAPTYDHRNWS